MKASKYCIDGSENISIRKLPTDAKEDGADKKRILEKFEKNKEEMARLQDVFHADGREGLIIVLQALDASGKDSIIHHVFSGMNPEGLNVHYYEAPTDEELAHDYLWRIHRDLPRRGEIAVLNRSHYEDVTTVDLEDIWKHYKMADRVCRDSREKFFLRRFDQIVNFEQYLYENSFRIVKIFLHVSKKEQAVQLLERIDVPEKNWKFQASDIRVHDRYDDYLKCFDHVINATATKHAPWYVLPGDQRWYTRYLLSEIVIHELSACKSAYPRLPEDEAEKMPICGDQLRKELGK